MQLLLKSSPNLRKLSITGQLNAISNGINQALVRIRDIFSILTNTKQSFSTSKYMPQQNFTVHISSVPLNTRTPVRVNCFLCIQTEKICSTVLAQRLSFRCPWLFRNFHSLLHRCSLLLPTKTVSKQTKTHTKEKQNKTTVFMSHTGKKTKSIHYFFYQNSSVRGKKKKRENSLIISRKIY